jgi:hypothetical protein
MPEAYRSKMTVARKAQGLNRQKSPICAAFGSGQQGMPKRQAVSIVFRL